jgi:hypothetical protein
MQGLLTPLLVAVALVDAPKARIPLFGAAAGLIALAGPGIYGGLQLWDMRQYVFDESIALEPRVQSKPLLEYTPKQALIWRQLGRYPHVPAQRAGLLAPGDIEVTAWSSHARRVRVNGEGPNTVWISTFYHPGWRARISGRDGRGGRELAVGAQPNSALLQVEVPAGRHEIEFRFASTTARVVGASISGATALALLAAAAMALRRRNRPV